MQKEKIRFRLLLLHHKIAPQTRCYFVVYGSSCSFHRYGGAG